MNLRFVIVAIILVLLGCSAEKKAMKALRFGKYQIVINYYKSVLETEPNNGEANYYIAESFRLSNRIREAEPYYARAGGPEINRDSVLLHYAQSLKANGKYEEARKKVMEIEPGDNEELQARVDAELSALNYIEELLRKESYYSVNSLEELNTVFSEYSPVYLNGELYFTSSRNNTHIYEATGTPFTELFKAETKGAVVNVNTITQLPDNINPTMVNVGCVTFSPDGRTMIFARGNTGKRKGRADVDLFLSRFRNGTWTEPTQININEPDSWESTPAFGPDGRTLYFSSNRKGGFGGLDVYTAHMDSRGRFTRVRNLGPEINTHADEMFPYVSESGKLYISSNGHPGYGMLDIFEVNRRNGKYAVDNLGMPMNSSADDFGIFLYRADRGFFTSNREGGRGDDDIYTFLNEDPNLRVVNYYLEGITMTPREDSTLEVLPNTKVTLLDAKGDVMQDYVTGNDGKFLFKVYEHENYILMGERDGYLVKRQPYTTFGKSVLVDTLTELVTNITLDTIVVLDRLEKNKVFVLENIYFDFDKYNIRADAARELDKLVALLNDNPGIKIEMSSHTDSVDSHAYNLELSQKRAESTVAYLIGQGIAPDRLVAKGYGETRPIARNTNPDGSDNPEGRQRNRRTEFKILEIGPFQKKTTDAFDEDKYFKNDN